MITPLPGPAMQTPNPKTPTSHTPHPTPHTPHPAPHTPTPTSQHAGTGLAGCTPQKPGWATRPFFGVEPVVLGPDGEELEGDCEGYLAMKRSWPGQLRGVYGDQKRYETLNSEPLGFLNNNPATLIPQLGQLRGVFGDLQR